MLDFTGLNHAQIAARVAAQLTGYDESDCLEALLSPGKANHPALSNDTRAVYDALEYSFSRGVKVTRESLGVTT